MMTHEHLGPIWYHSEPSDVPYSPNQFLGLDFFCRFLQQTGSKYVLHLIQMFHFKFCIYLGSKFAPYGKDGCAGIKPAEDQSDNSAMSTTGRRRGNMVNRVNSTDNQCFFEGSSHFQFAKGQ